MTLSNPAATQPRHDASTAYGADDSDISRVTRHAGRRSNETKASFKTTEFAVFVAAVIGVLIASYTVKATDGHADYFMADRAWFYVVLLSIGYMVSRGLAKSGSRHRADA
jgi:uncharacterized MAPEG superfamily protein